MKYYYCVQVLQTIRLSFFWEINIFSIFLLSYSVKLPRSGGGGVNLPITLPMLLQYSYLKYANTVHIISYFYTLWRNCCGLPLLYFKVKTSFRNFIKSYRNLTDKYTHTHKHFTHLGYFARWVGGCWYGWASWAGVFLIRKRLSSHLKIDSKA